MRLETDTMSASSKFDISSASPDRALYGSGPRGSYGVASLDRSRSFRENTENPLLSSLPNMTRSSSCVTQGDVLNFFQCVRFEPKSVVAEHKLNRPEEFSRLASTAVGIPLEDSLPASSKSKQLSSSAADDLRRLKSGVRESGTKARERVKILNDCLSVINKCFPTIPSRKRSRLDALSNDRPYAFSPIDRSAAGNKMGTQNHDTTSGQDMEMQKCEDRSRSAVLNKRPRTSMIDSRMDVRLNPPATTRSPGTMVKDVRHANGGTVQEEDITLPIGVDGWEKSKTKKKRTGIKQDISATSLVTKPVDGYRDSKHGLQQRIPTESRSRSTDSHRFRTGIANGGAGLVKAEATSQTSSGMRSSVSRTDSENSSLLQDRRERPGGQEQKERVNFKSVNKANSREDFSSGSPTSGPKSNANVRAPRSSSIAGVSKLSQRSSPSNDWELSNCTSKLPGLLATNIRKRTPVRSSSPPVGNWVQRPQKISRTARRTNLLPIFPINDENETQLPAQSPQLVKIKSDNFSPVTLSESEESGAAEVNMSKKCDKIEEKSCQNVQKMSTLLLPPRKKKVVNEIDHGEGVRRRGRTGRGSTKQVRSSRLNLDRNERLGRPPTRKLSDRKAYPRQKHVVVNMAPDFLVGSDIGHEELLAAVNAVTDTVQSLASPFWKGVESLFRFISDKDISYLKDQTSLGLSVDTPAPLPLGADNSTSIPNGYWLNEFGRRESDTKAPNEISLYQTLMSAIIPEEGFTAKENNYDIYGSQLETEKDMDGDTSSMNVNSFYEQDHSMLDTTIVSIPLQSFDRLQNGVLGHEAMLGKACPEYRYHNLTMDEKLILELNSIGIYPDLGSGEDDEINRDISRLDEKYQEKVSKKKSLLGNLLSSASEAKDLQEKEFEGLALDKLVGMAYQKYMSCWGRNTHGMKGANGKMAKQAALAFVRGVLEKYQDFERTGKSCFDEPLYKDLFLSKTSCLIPLNLSTDNESGKLNRSTSGCFAEIRSPAPMVTHQSPSNNLDIYSSELLSENLNVDQNTGKEENWSNKAWRKELSLDDVGGMTSTPPGIPSSLNGSFSCNAKGKRSGTGKIGRPATVTVKGEGKSKAKPKQKNANLSASVVALGNIPKQQKVMSSTINSGEFDDMLEEPIDLSGLQIPEMDGFAVHDELGGQGEDIGSWLNIEDDGLDHDFMGGLEIPMDDLSDLNMLG